MQEKGRMQEVSEDVLVGGRMQLSEDIIFVSDHLDPFYPVWELNYQSNSSDGRY